MMGKLFASHTSKDDDFVRELQRGLVDLGQDVWIDSREMRGGDPLWSTLQKAIDESSAFVVVVSPDSLQSKWVGKELKYALEVQKQREKDQFPVITLSLDDTKLGVLEEFFDEEPTYIPASTQAGGIDKALDAILVALKRRLPHDPDSVPDTKRQPLEELVLELTDLKFHEQDGIHRASARARLIYEPATPGQPSVQSEQAWRLIAPLGPIEVDELRWYLEKYAIWPSEYYRDRANKVKENLKVWGQLLHATAMPSEYTENVMAAWQRIDGNVADLANLRTATADRPNSGESGNEKRGQVGRRFSVHVDAALEAGASQEERETAHENATLLLGLPWELLHDEHGFLFQGAKPTRVRRRLPNTRDDRTVPVVDPPIRILLVTARPEDDSCGYIDHRASALPLVDAMENLGGLVQLHVLGPPTLAALSEELDRARRDGQPYHVVHFDGHGVYNSTIGLGGLCFEDPQDIDKLDGRRHVTVYTSELGPLLRDHAIPLVFLEACQTATAEQASESVASELLKVGVASVVAMSHSVLVETARRFVEAFYASLAQGRRVGDAMLAGQRWLKDDTFRAQVFGVGEFHLEDWFVPVLFQEKDDPQLFRTTLAPQTQQDIRTRLGTRQGHLPPTPDTGFVGRSRELLALERLLSGVDFQPASSATSRYAVIRGQGGEGKTTLAAEFARWMVRSQQFHRSAFVSVETHSTVPAVVDALGKQIVHKDFTAAGDLEEAIQRIEQTLREQATLLVVDNMESILLPPFSSLALQSRSSDGTEECSTRESQATMQAWSEDARHELTAILALCTRLLDASANTRIVFTSREPLPAPFDDQRNRRELHQLDRQDAVKLVERVLNENDPCATGSASAVTESTEVSNPDTGKASGTQDSSTQDAQQEQIEQLVDAVHCHARTLALLAPPLRSHGVESTRESLVELMAQMQRRFPGNREQSVYASVELSLGRMSPENRERANVLGVFHGGVNLQVLQLMMQWEQDDVRSLAIELINTGLATANPYNHLTLNPALCPYLREGSQSRQTLVEMDEMQTAELDQTLASSATKFSELTARWVEAMRGYATFLYQQRSQQVEVAATLTALELPNLFALLDHIRATGDPAATIDLATQLFRLLQNAGKPRLLARVAEARDTAATELGDTWNHAAFEAERTHVEQQLASGQFREVLDGAAQLLDRALAAGEQAYTGADYDLALAYIVLARVLRTTGGSQQALLLLDESRQRFETIAKEQDDKAAEGMAAKCFSEQGDCLRNLGRLDEAAAAYEERIRRGEQLGDDRGVAVGQGQLGTVHLDQHRYPEALAAYADARERFTKLDEPGSVAVIWHQTGMAHQDVGQPEAAEDAYQNSLAIVVRLGDVAGQARTLLQLGNLYKDVLDRPEQAATFYRQAADKYVEIGDTANEGRARNNLADTLRTVGRPDEARQEIHRTIACFEPFGHAAQPWTAWHILANIETDAGNSTAAAEAKGKAINAYLAYRRDRGENHNPDGRIALTVTRLLLDGNPAEAESQLQQHADDPNLPAWLRPFIQALQSITTGSRDRTLANNPELDCAMAAEILFLIETLEDSNNES